MVTYQPSSASKSIIIGEMVIATYLTLSIPAGPIAEKTPFIATGRLTFKEGGIDYGLQGRTINLTGADAPTSIVTLADGTYSKSLTISRFGTYTITASFAGASGLAAAEAYAPIGVTGAADYTPLILLGLLAAGAYIFRKELKIKI